MDISQGSTVTHLKRDEIFSDMFSWFWQWKSLKIGQYLMKLWDVQECAKFLGHPIFMYSADLVLYWDLEQCHEYSQTYLLK